jgi:hypothetical protein
MKAEMIHSRVKNIVILLEILSELFSTGVET